MKTNSLTKLFYQDTVTYSQGQLVSDGIIGPNGVESTFTGSIILSQ